MPWRPLGPRGRGPLQSPPVSSLWGDPCSGSSSRSSPVVTVQELWKEYETAASSSGHLVTMSVRIVDLWLAVTVLFPQSMKMLCHRLGLRVWGCCCRPCFCPHIQVHKVSFLPHTNEHTVICWHSVAQMEQQPDSRWSETTESKRRSAERQWNSAKVVTESETEEFKKWWWSLLCVSSSQN